MTETTYLPGTRISRRFLTDIDEFTLSGLMKLIADEAEMFSFGSREVCPPDKLGSFSHWDVCVLDSSLTFDPRVRLVEVQHQGLYDLTVGREPDTRLWLFVTNFDTYIKFREATNFLRDEPKAESQKFRFNFMRKFMFDKMDLFIPVMDDEPLPPF